MRKNRVCVCPRGGGATLHTTLAKHGHVLKISWRDFLPSSSPLTKGECNCKGNNVLMWRNIYVRPGRKVKAQRHHHHHLIFLFWKKKELAVYLLPRAGW